MGERKKASKRTLPPKLTRRSHTKSRTGCNPCKNRRVKCGEELPACYNCYAKGLSCDYPSRIVCHNPSPPSTCVTSKPEVVKIPTAFSSQDFQAFHCYLLFGSPSLPLGNHSAWIQDIPRIAHKHEYLMQGILALGASHLWRSTSDDSFRQLSLKHRCRAIAGLKTALAEPDSWRTEGHVDAMLGTCYALTSQAAHMPDGIQDYLTLVNGCKLITERVREGSLRSAFNVALDRPYRTLGPGLRSILGESSDEDLICEGLNALKTLEHLMVLPAEKEFLAAVQSILHAFQAGAYEGYLMDIATYGMWYQLAGEHLKSFHESDTTPTKIMLAHLLGVSCLLRILIPIRRWPRSVIGTAPKQKLTEAMQWITAFQHDLSEELQPYLDWPASIMARLPEVVTTPSPSSKPIGLPPHMKEKMLQDMDTCVHVVLWDILTLCADLTAWFEDMLHDTINQQKQLLLWQETDTFDDEQSILVAIENTPTPFFGTEAMSSQFVFSEQTEAMIPGTGLFPLKVED